MLIVQKYGGATLETPEKIKKVAERLSELKKENHHIVAVVSAMGQTTNQLIHLSRQVSRKPQLRELDMLLSVGERISMSLVSMALHDLEIEAISLTGSQAGILTNDSHINAMITDVKAFRVTEALQKNKIVILAGFQGVNPTTKEITTLGRGGSDTTAVAIASYLKADRCEILKDVSSIFSADPKIVKTAKPLHHLTYDILLEMTYWGAKVLHYRSVELAKVNNVQLYIGPAALVSEGTLINKEIAMYESTQAIAVNSHHKVLELKFENQNQNSALGLFNKILKDNQIGSCQILHGTTLNHDSYFLITAPTEILDLIEKVCVESTELNLNHKNLCSVSLTCTGSSLNEMLYQAEKKMNENNIQPVSFIQSAMSLNFILNDKDKDQAIHILHSLIS